MRIRAHVRNGGGKHDVRLETNEAARSLAIPPKSSGAGSSANGGELLFLALATCYCNDIYREAARREIKVVAVEVDVDGEFGTEGEPARNVTYSAKVTAEAPEDTIRRLMTDTDHVAEIQNTLRLGMPVTLGRTDAVSVRTGN
jgi:organic hydroperoxide reductase OsmC/OhrA